jgi:hypothetical protein
MVPLGRHHALGWHDAPELHFPLGSAPESQGPVFAKLPKLNAWQTLPQALRGTLAPRLFPADRSACAPKGYPRHARVPAPRERESLPESGSHNSESFRQEASPEADGLCLDKFAVGDRSHKRSLRLSRA